MPLTFGVSSSALHRPADGFSHRIDIGTSTDNIIGPTAVHHRLYIGPKTDLLVGTASAFR